MKTEAQNSNLHLCVFVQKYSLSGWSRLLRKFFSPCLDSMLGASRSLEKGQ